MSEDLYNDNIDLTPDDFHISDGSSTSVDESTKDNPIHNWVIDDDTSAGTPGVTPTVPDPPNDPEELHRVVIEKRMRYTIPSYDPIDLKRYHDAGCIFYVVYTDGTEEVCDYTDVFSPIAEASSEYVIESQEIAEAIGQHFWYDDNGAHVTDVERDDWDTAASSNFNDLSNNKPYHNILMNSLGILLRRALYNLVSISKSAITFYDGLGNNLSNIRASFGSVGAIFREQGRTKATITSEGLSLYDNTGSISGNNEILGDRTAFIGIDASGAPYTSIGSSSKNHVTVEKDGIYGWTADKLVFGTQINANDVSEMYVATHKPKITIVASFDSENKDAGTSTKLYYIGSDDGTQHRVPPEGSDTIEYPLYAINSTNNSPISSTPAGRLRYVKPIPGQYYGEKYVSFKFYLYDANDNLLWYFIALDNGNSNVRYGLTDYSYVVNHFGTYYECAWFDADDNEISQQHTGEFLFRNWIFQAMSYEFPVDGLIISGGNGLPYIKYNDNIMYPTFMKAGWTPTRDVHTLPTLPCLVIDSGDGSIWMCNEGVNTPIGNTTGPYSNAAVESASAHGTGCITANPNQFVVGKYNEDDINGDYAAIIGNGTDHNNRSNALTVDWSGNVESSGGFNAGGEIVTSLDSIAIGSKAASSTTIPDLVNELRYTSGQMGSFATGSAYTKDGVTIPASWYNYIWIPHRSGGTNGQANGDNCNYGTLLISGMTANAGVYYLRFASGSIQYLRNLSQDNNTITAVKGNAESSYRTGNVNLTPANIGAQPAGSYLGTGGGTLTGSITIKRNDVNLKAGNNGKSGTDWPPMMELKDVNNYNVAFVGTSVYTDGTTGVELHTYGRNGSGTQVGHNVFGVRTNKSNNNTYSVSSPANFRSAIGAAASSDRRLKSDLIPLDDDAVEFIKSVIPYVYTINNERQVGLIAQDVYQADTWGTRMAFETDEEIDGLDDWEKMEDGSPTWKLDYIRLLPPTIRTLQKAMDQIEKLEKEVTSLKQQLDDIRKA